MDFYSAFDLVCSHVISYHKLILKIIGSFSIAEVSWKYIIRSMEICFIQRCHLPRVLTDGVWKGITEITETNQTEWFSIHKAHVSTTNGARIWGHAI